jgi:hypothetical protein
MKIGRAVSDGTPNWERELKSTIVISVFLLLIGLLVLGCPACSSKDDYIGIYTSVDKGDPAQKENVIVLMKSGQGIWKCCGEQSEHEVSFTWTIMGKELRIYTKGGGVMTGELRKHSFVMAIPGRKALTFNKTGDVE